MTRIEALDMHGDEGGGQVHHGNRADEDAGEMHPDESCKVSYGGANILKVIALHLVVMASECDACVVKTMDGCAQEMFSKTRPLKGWGLVDLEIGLHKIVADRAHICLHEIIRQGPAAVKMVTTKCLGVSLVFWVASVMPLVSATTFDLHFHRFGVEQVNATSGFAVSDASRCKQPLGRSVLRQEACTAWPKHAAFDQYMFTWARHRIGFMKADEEIELKYGYGNCSVEVYEDAQCKGKVLGTVIEVSKLNTGKICHATEEGKAAQSAKIHCHPWPYVNWSENETHDYTKMAAEDHEYYEQSAEGRADRAKDQAGAKDDGAADKFDGTTDNIDGY
nr:hypothetical protein CFP56_54917 [Quercus suber]